MTGTSSIVWYIGSKEGEKVTLLTGPIDALLVLYETGIQYPYRNKV